VTVGVLRAFGDWVVVREGSFAVVSVTGISISCVERILGENQSQGGAS
jgi:hypothetical protein